MKYSTILMLVTSLISVQLYADGDAEIDKILDQKEANPTYDTIKKAAARNNCKGVLFMVLCAIYKAENGPKGTEFGIMHPKAKDTNLDTQAGWAAATVVKSNERWKKAGRPGKLFLPYLASSYAPVSKTYDPNGLNKNWLKNVTFWYKAYRQNPELMETI
jgi:hypothetical protein